MKILLDTHVALWALADRTRLSPAATALPEDPDNECWVSSASAWELAIKVRLHTVDLGECGDLEVRVE